MSDARTGEVFLWGELTDGSVLPQKHLRGKKVKQLCGGYDHSLVIADGYRLNWLSDNPDADGIAEAIEDVRVHQVAVGAKHVAALTLDGSIFTWGNGDRGQLGLGGSCTQCAIPQEIQLPHAQIVQMSCGAEHMAAVLKNGDLYTWGRGFEGQTGQTSITSDAATNANLIGVQLLPKYVADFQRMKKKIKSVACGHLFTVCLTDAGEIYSFGEGPCGQLGLGKKGCSKKLLPQLVKSYAQVGSSKVPFVEIATGWAHTLALTQTGEMYVWGFNQYGQLGLGNTKTEYEPKPLVFTPGFGGKVTKIDAASHYSAALTANQEVFTWGNGRYGKLGHVSMSPPGNQEEEEEEEDGVPPMEIDYSNKHVPTRVNAMAFEGRLPTKISCAEKSMSVFSPTVITGLFPTSGPVCGQTHLILEGAGYWPSDDITVRFTPLADPETGVVPDISARAVLGEFLGEGKVRCRTPKMSAPCLVKVELALNGKAYTKDGMRFKYYPTPYLTAVAPQFTHVQGGERIHVTGDDLHEADEVTVRFQECGANLPGKNSPPPPGEDDNMLCKFDYEAVVLKILLPPPPKTAEELEEMEEEDDEDDEDEDEDKPEVEPQYEYKIATEAPSFAEERAMDSLPMRCTVAVSFNGQDFHPVHGMQLSFHDCRITAVAPTCAPTLVAPDVDALELCGQSFLRSEQIQAYFIYPPKPRELTEDEEAKYRRQRDAALEEEPPRLIAPPMEEQVVVVPATYESDGVVRIQPPPLQEKKPPPMLLDEEGNPVLDHQGNPIPLSDIHGEEGEEGEDGAEEGGGEEDEEEELIRNIAVCSLDEETGEWEVEYNKPVQAKVVLSLDGGASFVGAPPNCGALAEAEAAKAGPDAKLPPGVAVPYMPPVPEEPVPPPRPTEEELDAGLASVDEILEMEYDKKMAKYQIALNQWLAARQEAMAKADSLTFDYFAPGQCKIHPPCGPMSGGTRIQVMCLGEDEAAAAVEAAAVDKKGKRKSVSEPEEQKEPEPDWFVASEFAVVQFHATAPPVEEEGKKKGKKKGKKEEVVEEAAPVELPEFEGEGKVAGVCETKEVYEARLRKDEEQAAGAAEGGEGEAAEGEAANPAEEAAANAEAIAAAEAEAAAKAEAEAAAKAEAEAAAAAAAEAEGEGEGEEGEGGEGEETAEKEAEPVDLGPQFMLFVTTPAIKKDEAESQEAEAAEAAEGEAKEGEDAAEGEAAPAAAEAAEPVEVPEIEPMVADTTIAMDGQSFFSCGDSSLSKFTFYADPVITGATPAEAPRKAQITLDGQHFKETGWPEGVQVKLVCLDTVEVLVHEMDPEDVLGPLDPDPEPVAAPEVEAGAEDGAEVDVEAIEAAAAADGEEGAEGEAEAAAAAAVEEGEGGEEGAEGEEGEEGEDAAEAEEAPHQKVRGTPLVDEMIVPAAVVAKTGTLQFSMPAELELIHWQAAADEKQAKLVAELEEGAEPPLPPVAPERVRFAIMATLNQQQFTEPFTGFELVNGAA